MSNRFAQFAPQRQANRFAQFAPSGSGESREAMHERLRARLAAGEAGISPEARQRQAQIDAQAMGDVERARRAQLVRDNPIGAAASAAIQGVPFVGEYVDEAFGAVAGEGARDRIRAAQRGMQENYPVGTALMQIGTGIASTGPIAAAALPRLASGGSAIGTALRAGGAGALAGGVEGVVSGYGAGVEGERGRSAAERGVIGGLAGGVIGAAAPAVSAGLRRLFGRLRQSDVQTIAREFEVSDEAARVIRRALQAEDFDAAAAAVQRAGGRAMLADAGDATRTLLDASMTGSAGAARVGRQAIDARAGAGGREFTEILDRFFGRPEGVRTAQAGIRSGSSAARASAYDAAYAAPIDYSSRAGMRLESLGGRVPAAVVQRANRLMQLGGDQSRQIMAQIGDDGAVTFQRLPDVRQWDYITRALNDLAESGEARGAMGGMTAESRALSGLAREIRDVLRSSVPEYGEALRQGADAIGRTRAVETGASLLLPSTTREQARAAQRGMTAAERTAARQGLRSYIDDLMARTTQALTDPNMDAREAIAAWRRLSSRQAQENITMLMGEGRARGFAREVDRIATDFELRAAVAANSRTAVRQAVQGEIQEIAQGGVLSRIVSDPLRAPQLLTQALTGTSADAVAARQAGLYDEIVQALTRTRGAAEADRIMRRVGGAIGSEPISQARADFLARQITGALAGGAYQRAQQSQAR